MEQLSKSQRNLNKTKQYQKLKKEKLISNRTKHYKRIRELNSYFSKKNYEQEVHRRRFIKSLYKTYKYNREPAVVKIDKSFGIEENQDIDRYLDKAAEFVDFDSRSLFIDIKDCERIWPSAIVLLVSLKKWVELCYETKFNNPAIYSGDSNCKEVNDYLSHCGFYDFVHRDGSHDEKCFPDNQIVKIQRELELGSVEKRHYELFQFVDSHADFDEDQRELFKDWILTEILNNVSEHGISTKDRGWWLIAQYHPTHKIISLCIADNGIGIRYSLMTGPQRDQIYIESKRENDGKFIALATKEKISGAIEASVSQKRFMSSRFERGSTRGHGLARIREACEECEIRWSILSHCGYVFFDKDGRMEKIGAKSKRVFAGTMYQLNIKAK